VAHLDYLSGVKSGVNLSQIKRMLSRLPFLRRVGVEAVKLLAVEGKKLFSPTAIPPLRWHLNTNSLS
jgi:hypothetical protein